MKKRIKKNIVHRTRKNIKLNGGDFGNKSVLDYKMRTRIDSASKSIEAQKQREIEYAKKVTSEVSKTVSKKAKDIKEGSVKLGKATKKVIKDRANKISTGATKIKTGIETKYPIQLTAYGKGSRCKRERIP